MDSDEDIPSRSEVQLDLVIKDNEAGGSQLYPDSTDEEGNVEYPPPCEDEEETEDPPPSGQIHLARDEPRTIWGNGRHCQAVLYS